MTKQFPLVLLLVFTTLLLSGQKSRTDLSLAIDLDSLLEQVVLNENIMGVAAAYAIHGNTVWQSVRGFSNKKSNERFQNETKVRMASIAKPMTAIAVMQLVEKGLLDLDAPIQTYIPDYPMQLKTQITVKHLMSHTSGIAGYKNAKEAETKSNYPTLSDAVTVFKNRQLLFEPGTQYSYTSYGYTLLGLIIEKVSGMTFATYMQEHIWSVADMKNTGIDIYGVDEGSSSELYIRKRNGKTTKGKENNLSNRVPGGGFYTTVGDMLKFGNAVIDNVFITSETLHIMRQGLSLDAKVHYGLGWFLYNAEPNRGKIIGHGGAQTGCSSQLLIFPDEGIVSVVLANTSRAEITGFAIELLKIARK